MGGRAWTLMGRWETAKVNFTDFSVSTILLQEGSVYLHICPEIIQLLCKGLFCSSGWLVPALNLGRNYASLLYSSLAGVGNLIMSRI